MFIQTHQLFRIHHTCFELDAVDIDGWICIDVCLAGAESSAVPLPRQVVLRRADLDSNSNNNIDDTRHTILLIVILVSILTIL